ncbi:hypothetical protein RISK_002712 [Rhodopirellula islandica]|uniref:Uncharacterized protein n=1 Tax=Rhodopirellula islandica TaxID=595434 RepID=A0A0J1BFD6_RHOIS|nr:hypothetical protein RISK_002712 [Rhodopirellula islandica]
MGWAQSEEEKNVETIKDAFLRNRTRSSRSICAPVRSNTVDHELGI